MPDRPDYQKSTVPTAHAPSHQDGGSDELDLAGLTPGDHAPRHQDGGADELDATGLAGRADMVDRGDPAAYDFTQATLTEDGTWRDMDLSAIIPVGTKAVVLRVGTWNALANVKIQFRKKGNANAINVATVWNVTANNFNSADVIVYPDTNRVLEYNADNVAWAAISVLVAGWWV